MSHKLIYNFLIVDKTNESTDTVENAFKRYVGFGNSFVLAVNPDKKKLDELMGYESQAIPEYTGEDDNGKFGRVTFIVRTDPETCDGIQITNRLTFTVRNQPDYNRDKTKVRVIDEYGNSRYIPVEDAKEKKPIFNKDGREASFGEYHVARVGETDLTAFLRTYLCVPNGFTYNSEIKEWTLSNPKEGRLKLEYVDKYVSGDVSEIKEAIALQPNNKIKLLYGVRTTDEGKQYQVIMTKEDFIIRSNASQSDINRCATALADAKIRGSYANTELVVQPIAEYAVNPTDFSKTDSSKDADDEHMPWD